MKATVMYEAGGNIGRVGVPQDGKLLGARTMFRAGRRNAAASCATSGGLGGRGRILSPLWCLFLVCPFLAALLEKRAK